MECVTNVNPANVINFLFQTAVINREDVNALLKSKDDPERQCRELLDILHASENPQAFIVLYAAIKAESRHWWLIDRIDKFTDQLQPMYISDPTGQCVISTRKIFCIKNFIILSIH